jgi:arsenite methyltransferase
VLDLGSGGGIDVLLAARRVGPSGYAYGIEMTDECSSLPEPTPKRREPATSRSSKAPIEDVPLPDETVYFVAVVCSHELSR